ncbi:hypothetical protein F383_22448 [Gossypium arboreum]|uniref:Uncharacterized protein n=1 Tax=Gossypium arboreum TaxID=29729 RepID=A0A0B0MLS0_GOSAR|nr:hypothetical protein F383_22448 [Gossypium arboreum]
MIWKIKPLD